jgi:hypothetical protein
MSKNRYRLVLVFIVCFALSCDSNRLTQFATFATAGSQYVQNFHLLIQQAGSTMIAADSATFYIARQEALADPKGPAVTWDPRKDQIEQQVAAEDKLLAEYLANLQLLDKHATLLGSYFGAITQLTNGKAAASVSTSASNLLDSINKLNPDVENVKFEGFTAKQFVQGLTPLVVDHFEVKALDDQLKKDADTINQALNLQKAAVTALGKQITASTGVTLTLQEQTQIVLPYAQSAPLSEADWNSKRQAFLQTQSTLQNIDSATKAISQMQNQFQQLVTNKRAQIDFTNLINAINSMTGYVSSMQSAVNTTTKTK